MFEFVWNIILRKQQIETVQDFVTVVKGGGSKVKQMLMGAGYVLQPSFLSPLTSQQPPAQHHIQADVPMQCFNSKTKVVAPLMVLMLADGKSLVLSVVPKALLEMSRTQMRETSDSPPFNVASLLIRGISLKMTIFSLETP